MPTASWKGTTIAKSDSTIVVEGNHYFPADSVDSEMLRDSDHHTVCGWKGTASYHTIVVGGEINENAAWFYPEPKAAAAEIKGHIAFWKGVVVSDPS